MLFDLRESPKLPADRLGAHLLRYGDAVGLDFPVGMIRADAHVHRTGFRNKHELHFTARVFADDLHFGRRSEQIRAEPIKARYRARALHADRGKLGDMVFDRGLVAPGPSGNDQSGDLDAARRSFNQKFHAVSRSPLRPAILQGLKVPQAVAHPGAGFVCNPWSVRVDFSSDRTPSMSR